MRKVISDGAKSSPGVARSAPRSNNSFWIAVSLAREASSATLRRAIPIALLASSTSPTAAKRGSAFERREPSARPVAPESPVRV
jgi:hypothetical protein